MDVCSGWRLRQRPRCYRRARAGVLHSVPGRSITGSRSYGDITTAGALQVGLGALQPRPASITVVNEITVEAAAPAVWALVADASRGRIGTPRAGGCTTRPRPLPAGATFDWKAHPVSLHSVVNEWVPLRAATARFPGICCDRRGQ